MKTIFVDNIKCGGCANSIEKKLKASTGVQKVEVDIAAGAIHMKIEDGVDVEKIINKLARMGYPRAGTSTSFQKAKSFVSCAIGRVSKE